MDAYVDYKASRQAALPGPVIKIGSPHTHHIVQSPRGLAHTAIDGCRHRRAVEGTVRDIPPAPPRRTSPQYTTKTQFPNILSRSRYQFISVLHSSSVRSRTLRAGSGRSVPAHHSHLCIRREELPLVIQRHAALRSSGTAAWHCRMPATAVGCTAATCGQVPSWRLAPACSRGQHSPIQADARHCSAQHARRAGSPAWTNRRPPGCGSSYQDRALAPSSTPYLLVVNTASPLPFSAMALAASFNLRLRSSALRSGQGAGERSRLSAPAQLARTGELPARPQATKLSRSAAPHKEAGRQAGRLLLGLPPALSHAGTAAVCWRSAAPVRLPLTRGRLP